MDFRGLRIIRFNLRILWLLIFGEEGVNKKYLISWQCPAFQLPDVCIYILGLPPFYPRLMESSCISHQLPVGSSVSPDCQDLLLALLQRDPLARISFEEFFAHPFLDLEHVPSPLCLGKAVSNDI